jgi:hydroxymethylpyrimidine pyrophosphatase-like HAD family hydrolase
MLSYTGYSIAMGGGNEDAKKAADFVSDDIDDDGWAKGVRHFGLID